MDANDIEMIDSLNNSSLNNCSTSSNDLLSDNLLLTNNLILRDSLLRNSLLSDCLFKDQPQRKYLSNRTGLLLSRKQEEVSNRLKRKELDLKEEELNCIKKLKVDQ